MKVFRKFLMFIIVMTMIGLSGCTRTVSEPEDLARLSYNKEIIVISTSLDSTVDIEYVLKYPDISVKKVKTFDVKKGDTMLDLQKLYEGSPFVDKPEIVNAIRKVDFFDVKKENAIIDLQKICEYSPFVNKPEIVNVKLLNHTYENDFTVLGFCKKYWWVIIILLLISVWSIIKDFKNNPIYNDPEYYYFFCTYDPYDEDDYGLW